MTGFEPGNAYWPVAAKTIVEPHENMSTGGPSGRLSTCSGAMKWALPITRLAAWYTCSQARAMPKSITLTPPGPSMMLPGLKSQWMTFAAWMASSAMTVWMATSASRLPRSGPRPRRHLLLQRRARRRTR